ncbi:MAG: rhodanese-like domain-containing protein [Desulfobacteraceae bacterium]|jgi:rhodanese-related sulfurtransferase|nr:MAG: rhodanese-like domain-containing protein [Desulfobacteraceae bacterium]
MRLMLQITGIVFFSASLAVVANSFRKDRLPLVDPFNTQSECESETNTAPSVSVARALKQEKGGSVIFVDVRPHKDFSQAHIQGAVNLPYSFLEPFSENALDQLRKMNTVIVYDLKGAGAIGRRAAGEMKAEGVKGAVYLEGGLLAWIEAGGSHVGEGTPQDGITPETDSKRP